MSSTIIKWQPSIPNFPNSISVQGVYDDSEGFRIVVSDDNSPNQFRVIFANYIAYRNSDEGARLKSHSLFPNNSREWCLFKTNQSEFIDWIVSESTGIYSSNEITHYYFTTSDDIIEVLALEEPKIEQI